MTYQAEVRESKVWIRCPRTFKRVYQPILVFGAVVAMTMIICNVLLFSSVYLNIHFILAIPLYFTSIMTFVLGGLVLYHNWWSFNDPLWVPWGILAESCRKAALQQPEIKRLVEAKKR